MIKSLEGNGGDILTKSLSQAGKPRVRVYTGASGIAYDPLHNVIDP